MSFQPKQFHVSLAAAVVLSIVMLQVGVLHFSPDLLVFILMTSLIFVAAFVKPNVALAILVFSMLLSPEVGMGGVKGRSVVLRFDDFFILMLFFGWLARMAVHKDLGFIKVTPINQPILAYIVICLISSSFGILSGTTDPRHSFFYNLKYIEYFLLYFMVSNNLGTQKQVKGFVYQLVFVALIVSIFATHAALFQGMRATAPFEGEQGEPNTLAGYLILMIGLCLGILLQAPSLGKVLGFGGLAVFMVIPLMYTLSRSGWAGALAMFFAFVFFARRNRFVLVLVLGIVLINLPILVERLPKNVTQRYAASFRGGDTVAVGGQKITVDESASIRLRTWKSSLELWSHSPILGRGVPGGGVISDVQYTRVLREVGLVGFFAFLWMLVTAFRMGLRSYRDPRADDFSRGISLGYICSLVGLLVMGVAAEVFIIIRIMEPFWFLTAIVANLPEINERRTQTQGELVDIS